jgi:hypothetical protein
MRYKLRSLDVLSVAKLMACIHGCLGLLFLPFFLIVGALGAVAGGQNAAFGAIGMAVLAVLMPVLYAGMGFLIGALMAWLYNVISKRIGAIELRLDLAEATPVSAGPVI